MVKSGEVTRILILKSATENDPKLIRDIVLILFSHTHNFSSARFHVSFPTMPATHPDKTKFLSLI